MSVKITEYDKNILKLFTGTAMAQAVSFLVIPLIANQYGPVQYGIYAGFLASISILSVLSTGKYEMAIMSSSHVKEVVEIMKLGGWINLIICLTITIFALVVPLHTLNTLFGIKNGSRLMFMIIPIGTYLLASFQIYNYWLVKQKKFAMLSLNKILRSVLFGAFALTIGYFWPNALALIISLTLGHFFSNIFLRSKIKAPDLNTIIVPSKEQRSRFVLTSKKYRSFPIYILPAELINVVCAQLPVFVFLWMFNPKDSGYFSFILSLLNIPITLLAGAVLDVFKEQASSDYRETGSCRDVYVRTLKKMLMISILPFILLGLFGNDIIVLLFGQKWVPAGKFLNILLFMFFFKFISSPLSFIFYIVNKQREDFIWHIYILLTTVLTLYVGAIIYNDILLTVKLYAINFSIIYLIYLVRSFQFAKKKMPVCVT